MTIRPDIKSAVVFGATGLVGRALIDELSENKDFERIVAVVRKKLPHTYPKLEQVQLDDFSKLMDLKDKLKASVYFCCVGTTIKTAGSKEAFAKVDLDIPRIIAQLGEAIPIQAMVVISSLGAKAGSSNFYLNTKGEMEKAVREIYTGNLKFVRPSVLMGDRIEFRFGEKATVIFMKAFGWLFAGPLRKYRGIYARDVARAMIKISDLPSDIMIYESDKLQKLAHE
jgi:uncharacterized protein YbjT (DUF2867 family)